MLILSTVEMPRENLRIARDIQERGLKEYPSDAELWLSTGMFVAYMAIQRLPENEDKREWKAQGARMIQHACEIWPQNEQSPQVCLTSLNLFEKAGQTEAGIANMERLLAIAEDAETRSRAMSYLAQLMGERDARQREEIAGAIDELQFGDLPGLSRAQYQIMLPRSSVQSCVGLVVPWVAPQCLSAFSRFRPEAEQN